MPSGVVRSASRSSRCRSSHRATSSRWRRPWPPATGRAPRRRRHRPHAGAVAAGRRRRGARSPSRPAWTSVVAAASARRGMPHLPGVATADRGRGGAAARAAPGSRRSRRSPLGPAWLTAMPGRSREVRFVATGGIDSRQRRALPRRRARGVAVGSALRVARAAARARGPRPVREGRSMKITVVETFLVPPRWLFLRIETDEGVVGWGEPVVEGRAPTVARRGRRAGRAARRRRPAAHRGPLAGADQGRLLPRRAGARPAPSPASTRRCGTSPARCCGAPVHELLGGPVRDRRAGLRAGSAATSPARSPRRVASAGRGRASPRSR